MKKWLSVWLAALLLLAGVACAKPAEEPTASAVPAASEGTAATAASVATTAPAYAAYNGKRIGVLVGPLMEDVAKEYFPDSEYLLLNSYPDCITALLSGRSTPISGTSWG